ncbi:BgTH12-05785 [Blumeria graminis f. sp. triticale]|uniref:BgtA-21022 n=3 Tax=Blumeria graminis TaxID=34373 RepID=A0A9X9MK99_BLUGR|nr:hypothetical protein BGT96224_A21022 [Blumeria graminis f. sp. tritici 96224]CAD6504048.1 BgTH12-05785 [Blumeria graminis f. sp. triticale]VDB90783.1 BgtA-21022 [Blumeria graminis f. sp. tritici]
MFPHEDIEEHLARNPLDEILEVFRLLYSTYFDTPCVAVFEKPKDPNKCRIPIRNLIRDFVGNVTVRYHLSCWLEKLGSKLITINNWMKSTQFYLVPFEPLIAVILNDATDVEVFNSVIRLAKNLETMKKASDIEYEYLTIKYIAKLVGKTHLPVRQPMKNSEDILRRELSVSSIFNTKCSWEKFFEASRLKTQCEFLSQEYMRRSAEAKFKFPAVLTKTNICKWIKVIEQDLICSLYKPLETLPTKAFVAPRKTFMHAYKGTKSQISAAGQVTVGQSKRQYNFFLKQRNLPSSDYHHWRNILVIGKFTESTKSKFLEYSLQLSDYIHKLLLAQPLRLFVHGFIFSGKNLELWMYDRSGRYSCSYINTGKFSDKLIHVLAAYKLMSNEEHGLVPNIQYHPNLKIVVFKVSKPEEQHELILHPVTINQQRALVSRGTSCYQAINNSYVMKLS